MRSLHKILFLALVYIKNHKMFTLLNPAMRFLGTNLKEFRNSATYVCTKMIIAMLFIIEKSWKQTK